MSLARLTHALEPLCALILLGQFAACATTEQLNKLRSDLEEAVANQKAANTRLAAVALCSDQVADFVACVRAGECPAQDTTHLLRTMTQQRHAVVYYDPNQKIEDQPDRRVALLRELTNTRRLFDGTYFMVVARRRSPAVKTKGKGRGALGGSSAVSPAEAEKEATDRAQVVIDELLKERLGLKKEQVKGPYVYQFCMDATEIDKFRRQDDLPMGSDPSDPSLGVWIFRIDCWPGGD